MNDMEKLLESIAKNYDNLQEIRLRSENPLCVVIMGRSFFLDSHGEITTHTDKMLIIKKEDITDIFMKICRYSVHAYKNQIKEGYITTDEGHRIGLAGKYSVNTFSSSDITSLNIRIARQYKGCSNEIISRLFTKNAESTLIIGVPSSGKTTLLRDIAVNLSEKMYTLSIIDSRNEICGFNNGRYTFDIGRNTDVITGTDKSQGIMQALRVLSPNIIICDEMGGTRDVKAVTECLNSGVKLIGTVHAGSKDEVIRSQRIQELLNSGAFCNLVLLEGSENPCVVKSYGRLIRNDEDSGNNSDFRQYRIVWCDENNKHT